MAGYKIGTSDVDNVMIGSQQVDKIYIGTDLVWQNENILSVYTFDVDTMGWTGNNIAWSSKGHNASGSIRINPGNAIDKTGMGGTHKLRFWFYQDYYSEGAITGLYVAGVYVATGNESWNAWAQYEASITPPSTPPFMVSISNATGGVPSYGYIDDMEIIGA